MTHPGDLLLGVNLVILRGRREVQVALAITSSYTHSVYLVLAGSTIQTKRKRTENTRLVIYGIIDPKNVRYVVIREKKLDLFFYVMYRIETRKIVLRFIHRVFCM